MKDCRREEAKANTNQVKQKGERKIEMSFEKVFYGVYSLGINQFHTVCSGTFHI